VRFTCAPDNVDRLIAAVENEIRAAQARGFPEAQLDNVRTAQRRALELATRNNGYWLSRLGEHLRHGTDPRLILTEPHLIDAVGAPAVQAAARTFFSGAGRLLGVHRPATPPTTASPRPAP
jgi:zinc protease